MLQRNRLRLDDVTLAMSSTRSVGMMSSFETVRETELGSKTGYNTCSAPKLWNALPQTTRASGSLLTF